MGSSRENESEQQGQSKSKWGGGGKERAWRCTQERGRREERGFTRKTASSGSGGRTGCRRFWTAKREGGEGRSIQGREFRKRGEKKRGEGGKTTRLTTRSFSSASETVLSSQYFQCRREPLTKAVSAEQTRVNTRSETGKEVMGRKEVTRRTVSPAERTRVVGDSV